jgi:hypothetical protein
MEYFPFVCAVIWTACWAWIFQKGSKSQQWPYVVGKIIEAKVKSNLAGLNSGVFVGTNTGWSIGRRGNETVINKITYRVEVTYAYTANGKSLVGNRRKFADFEWYYTINAANEELKNFPVGKELCVYYDPINPSDSVLKVGNSTRTQLTLFIGIGLMLFSLIAAWNGWIKFDLTKWNVR